MLFPEWKCSCNKRKALFTVFLKCQFKYCPIAWMFYSRHTSNKVNRLHETLCENCPNTEFFSGPYFPAFGLNTERYGVSLRIQSECGETQTRIIPNTDTFRMIQP